MSGSHVKTVVTLKRPL